MIKEGDRYPLYRDYVIVQAGDDLVLKCAAHSSEEPTITWTKNVRQAVRAIVHLQFNF